MNPETTAAMKIIYGDEPLSFDTFCDKMKEVNLVDLGEGHFVDKNKYVNLENEYKEHIKSSEAASKIFLKDIEKMSKEKLDPAEVAKQMDEIKSNYENEINDMKKKSSDLQKATLIKDAIVKAGGNADIIFPLLIGKGDIEKISLDGDNLKGITDILQAYKTDTSTAGLFVNSDTPPPNTSASSTQAAGGQNNDKKYDSLSSISENIDDAEEVIMAAYNK